LYTSQAECIQFLPVLTFMVGCIQYTVWKGDHYRPISNKRGELDGQLRPGWCSTFNLGSTKKAWYGDAAHPVAITAISVRVEHQYTTSSIVLYVLADISQRSPITRVALKSEEVELGIRR
jgi:hypothetical protein